jgi:DNA-binding MarR family transcriptional regulator
MVDPLQDYPGYALRRASAVATAGLLKRLEAFSLRSAEATVLLVIEANPGITQSEIGRLLDIATANMTPLASRLEERELIVRAPVDGRSQGLSLSGPGRRLTQRVHRTIVDYEKQLLDKIPVAQRSAFLAALRAIRMSGGDKDEDCANTGLAALEAKLK